MKNKKANQKIIDYYNTLESRLGYIYWLKETKHFGFYPKGKENISMREAQRLMEDKLGETLDLKTEARILDAGCGMGNVALYLAKKFSWNIEGIDILDWNIEKAGKKSMYLSMENRVHFQVMDYAKLYFTDNHFDGVYTMETLVHARDYRKVLKEFYRVLKPGGEIVLIEYSLASKNAMDNYTAVIWEMINEETGMHSLWHFSHRKFPEILQNVGFKRISVEDFTENIIPMLKKLYTVALIPYQVIKLLNLQRKFINATSSVEGYKVVTTSDCWRYNIITAEKPK